MLNSQWSLSRLFRKPRRRRGWRPQNVAPAVEFLEDRRLLAAVLQVDDDLAQCPDADYTSINAAVAAASPGDTILVCPGLYNESVIVDKPLTLRGAFAGHHAAKRSGNLPDPRRDSIVDPPDIPVQGLAPGFNVQANDVVIDGFTIQGATENAGILTSRDFSGYEIRNNEIRDNTQGLYFNSSGADLSVAESNAFVANNRPGAAAGNGIYSDQGLRNALVEKNFFTRNENSAMVFDSFLAQASDVTITKNVSVEDGSGVVVFNSEDFEIDRNVILRSTETGIFIGNNVQNVDITRNVVHRAGGSGIAVRDFGAVSTTTDILVGHNLLTYNGRHGVLLQDTSGNTVERNFISRNGRLAPGDGVSLQNADDNVIRRNHIERNSRDGIRVDAASADNHIVRNKMKKNAEHDCHDDSVGTGTAGTANFWFGNEGRTENRPGLCKRGKHGHGGHGDD